ncbi:Fur-regulated basic protein FbpA [Bacillus sp. JJ1533]|uniref:Fur-regulated basic protein FbpA n=1 Tax=Bacillus sp. JJ1533 TaxID=3122959 RepID=UPI002FFFAB24
MSLLRDSFEKRRNELINKLLDLDQYKKDGKHLFELTLSELEYAHFKAQSDGHPHSNNSSIRWKNF